MKPAIGSHHRCMLALDVACREARFSRGQTGSFSGVSAACLDLACCLILDSRDSVYSLAMHTVRSDASCPANPKQLAKSYGIKGKGFAVTRTASYS
jgi:hypothetical protein